MTFSTDAWERAQQWYGAICEHSFIHELGQGTLASETFVRYIVDDRHYLARYARALATTSARWPEPAGAAMLAASAVRATEAEQVVHATMLANHGVDVRAVAEPTPTCLAYANTVLADACIAPPEVALAALLPCYRIYAEVGRYLVDILTGAPSGQDAHPYETWLRMYGDPAFAQACQSAERLADDAAEREPGAVEAMHAAYQRSARFEWMFWDASWRGESWPTPSAATSTVAAAKI